MKLKYRIIGICTGMAFAFSAGAAIDYNEYFTTKRLRFDFLLAGNQKEVTVFPTQVLQEKEWAGSRNNMVDERDLGTYRYRVFDASDRKLLFASGFCPLFQEWQTTSEAKSMDRAFYQSVFFPFPKKDVILAIEQRGRDGKFQPLFESVIRPDDYFIRREEPPKSDVISLLSNGKSEDHVDVLFLPEGYAEGEREKFTKDVARMCDHLFSAVPFSERKEAFNVRAVWTPSMESGTDIPGEHKYANTLYNSTFYTFDIDRYLTTSDMKSVYDAASSQPWDHIILLVNTHRYGGGGFYNFLTVCSSDHPSTPKVLVHEFGHAFAGLGDEYYNSSVAYEDYYNLAVEPWEPNLTTMVDFDSKWKNMVPDGIPVPTPRTGQYTKVIGAFEGGGYMAKGIFSPMQDCRMKSNNTEDFCPVCQKAILETIEDNTR